MKKSSKILAGVLMTAVLATGAGMLTGCGETPNTSALGNTTDIYGFAGATTGILASNQEVSSQMLAASSISTMENTTDTDNLKTQINDAISQTLDKYMNVFDSVVGGNKPVNVNDETSDKEEYDHKLTITASSIDGQTTTCVLYFNETLLDNENKKVSDSDDEERETKLEGELYLNDSATPFYVSGSKEIDPDDNEMEVEFVAQLVKGDSANQVVFKQEREEENGEIEEEYVFELTVNNVTTSFSFEIEKDAHNNIEVEYEQKIGTTPISFEIKKESDNSITISTKSFLGTALSINVKVETEGGQERYVYTIPTLDNFEIKGSLR